MKKQYILALSLVLLAALGLQAQSKKNIGNFSLFQHYYNPALTGYDGSAVKALYRNQWTGFEDAPKLLIATAELDPVDSYFWRSNNETGLRQEDRFLKERRGKHAFGLTVLRDQFGPFTESRVNLGYSSKAKLSWDLDLKWGFALTYNMHRLDGSRLNIGPREDPNYQEYIGKNSKTSRGDVNLGIALTAQDYYLGYALLDASEGKLVMSGDALLDGMAARQHVVQGGYRRAFTEEFGLVLNGLMNFDNLNKETLEAQLKAVYQNKFWLGTGIRAKEAMTFTAGVQLDDFRVGYVHEMSKGFANNISNGTNELVLTYNLFPNKSLRATREITLW